MVKNLPEMPDKNTIKVLEKKLDNCRNQDNNPDSDVYKRKVLQELQDEDELPVEADVSMQSNF